MDRLPMSGGAAQPAPGDTLAPRVGRNPLVYMAESQRMRALDVYESYYKCRQYEGRRYDWDGRMRGYDGDADIEPGWYVPLARRRPSVRFEAAKMIVRRYTALVFGQDRFPQLVIEGDTDAQDYVRELSTAARLKAKMQAARNLGGAMGLAALSFGFVKGKPRVRVHNPKHVTVLEWEDRYELRPKAVLESWAYPATEWDSEGRPKTVKRYFARYWDDQIETTWDPISEETARLGVWSSVVPSKTAVHGFGFCPVYLAQNLPDEEALDGESDYDGLLDTLDSINYLASATAKGTIANVDPTLVIKDDPGNKTSVKKGSDNAIWSKAGAEYLEIKGQAVQAAMTMLDREQQYILAVTGVVLADPKELAAGATSAAALRLIYMPMLVTADTLRDQYGVGLLVPLLQGMLQAARMIENRPAGAVYQTADGRLVQDKPTVVLPPRVDQEGKETPRKPGTSENITLNWPPYFPNTWTDNKLAIETIQLAAGNKAIASKRTAIENVAPILGIADVDAELEELEREATDDAARMVAAMQDMGGGESAGVGFDGATNPKEEKEDDED
jgi:hypothetical protein